MKNAFISVLIGTLIGGGTAMAATLVTSAGIMDGTIRCKDLRPGLCKKIKNPPVQVGPMGPQGPKGDPGPQGEPGRDGKDYVPPPPTDETEVVSSLTGKWSAVENNCLLPDTFGHVEVQDSLVYGPFKEGGAFAAASFSGFAGRHLKDFDSFSYRAMYEQSPDLHGAAPMLRIITENDTSVVDFIPESQQAGSWQDWHVEGASKVTYTNNGRVSTTWGDVVNLHGDEVVKEIRLQAGCRLDQTKDSSSRIESFSATMLGQKHTYTFKR